MNSHICNHNAESAFEKTKAIDIHNNKNILEKGLKQNSFNPLKDSPPNTFLVNLNKRYNKYYNNHSLYINEDTDETK